MKKCRKLFALMLAFIMTLALGVTAYAATITINKAVKGETYTAYKLFDVSVAYDSDGNATAYSYYITVPEDDDDAKALVGILEEIGLTFTTSADGNTYYVETTTVESDDEDQVVFVSEKDGEGNITGTMTAAEVASALKSYVDDLGEEDANNLGTGKTGQFDASSLDSEDGTGTYTISDLAEGYYFIDTSLGSLCILNTTGQTIYEKNGQPSISKKVYEDSEELYLDSATIDAVDTIYYQLIVTVGTGVDDDYTITDILPAGFSYDDTSVTVVGDATTSWVCDEDNEDDSQYTVEIESVTDGEEGAEAETKETMTIVLKEAALDDVTFVNILYSVKVKDNMTLMAGYSYTNDVSLSYKSQTYIDTASVVTYDFGTDTEGKPTLVKIDGATANDDEPTALKGVKFVLSKTGTDDDGKDMTLYAKFNDGYLTGWTSSKDDATELVTDEDGGIYAYGLDADTYILTETETLDGYNLMSDTITVVIDEDGNVTYYNTSEGSDEAASKITVKNSAGSLLPSTGGIGTTIFYAVGIVLMAGAVFFVVRRKRA